MCVVLVCVCVVDLVVLFICSVYVSSDLINKEGEEHKTTVRSEGRHRGPSL